MPADDDAAAADEGDGDADEQDGETQDETDDEKAEQRMLGEICFCCSCLK